MYAVWVVFTWAKGEPGEERASLGVALLFDSHTFLAWEWCLWKVTRDGLSDVRGFGVRSKFEFMKINYIKYGPKSNILLLVVGKG